MESVRQALLAAREVDIGDADGVARLREERRRAIDRLARVERHSLDFRD